MISQMDVIVGGLVASVLYIVVCVICWEVVDALSL